MRWCSRFLTALVAGVVVLAGPTVAQQKKMQALVIANEAYRGEAALRAAKTDGLKVRELLGDLSYAADLRPDVANKIEFIDHWNSFLSRLNYDGLALFYFSGHGAEIDHDSYLLPTGLDPETATETNLLAEGISLRRLFDDFRKQQKKLKSDGKELQGIFIIDACRSETKESTKRSGTKGPFDKPTAIPIAPPHGIFVLYATGAGQVAHTELGNEEGQGPHPSVYTRHLTNLLKQPNSLQSIARRLKWQVHMAVAAVKPGHPQTPAYFDDLSMEKPINLKGEPVSEGESDSISLKQLPPSKLTSAPEAGRDVWECEDCPQLVVVPHGKFKMGSKKDEIGRENSEEASDPNPADPGDRRLTVEIDRPFAIGKTEVTITQFRAYLDDTKMCPAHPFCVMPSSDLPVTKVTWSDSIAYTDWLNKKKGLELDTGPQSKSGYYRLPTEAEWEYAARAGTDGRFVYGDEEHKLCQYGNGADQELRALILANRNCNDRIGRRFAQVKTYKPNGFGLYDVHGNAWEWVLDCWSNRLESVKAKGGAFEQPDCRQRVARGGSWLSAPNALRLAKRVHFLADHGRPTIGFRVMRVLPQQP